MSEQNALALMQKDVLNVVEGKIGKYVERGSLHLPADYSASNAMRSAWLILQETVDRNKAPVLQACTTNSIANAMLDMAVQGLNPQKKQCYFIAYGDKLTCQRSYFGTMALAKRFNPQIKEVVAEVVYDGDELEYDVRHGQKIITKHSQKLANIDKTKILAAYAEVIDHEGVVISSILRTWDEILASWTMSKAYPIDDNGELKPKSTHARFTADMCKRTVINAVCKPFINASSDAQLFAENFNRADRIAQDADLAEEVEQNGNGEEVKLPEQGPAEEARPELAEAEPCTKAEEPGY